MENSQDDDGVFDGGSGLDTGVTSSPPWLKPGR